MPIAPRDTGNRSSALLVNGCDVHTNMDDTYFDADAE